MKFFRALTVALAAALVFIPNADAKKDKGGDGDSKAGPTCPPPVEEVGVQSMDDYFGKLTAINDKIAAVKTSLDGLSGSINEVAGVPADASLDTAVAEIKAKIEGGDGDIKGKIEGLKGQAEGVATSAQGLTTLASDAQALVTGAKDMVTSAPADFKAAGIPATELMGKVKIVKNNAVSAKDTVACLTSLPADVTNVVGALTTLAGGGGE